MMPGRLLIKILTESLFKSMKHAVLIIVCLCFCYPGLSQEPLAKTKIIAHRGAWKKLDLPQNSIAALRAAINAGCFASECDIWMTADSVLVVNHDPHFYGMAVETSTYDELLKKKYPNGESIATLAQFLDVIRTQTRVRLVLDIKPSKLGKERSLITARRSYEMVTARNAQHIVDYILFDYDACLELERIDPKANIAYLNGDKSPKDVAADGLWGIDYSYRAFHKNPGWIEEAKRLGLTVNIWTVNDGKLAESFIEQHVDFITTDEPELLLKMVE